MNTLIFSFGLAVTLIVGSGLVLMIVAKNRALERAAEADAAKEPSRP